MHEGDGRWPASNPRVIVEQLECLAQYPERRA
jgi:hypothetical protein